MKTNSMRKRGGAFATLVLCLAFSGNASAAFLSPGSEIGFIGTWAPVGSTNLTEALGASFPADNDATVIIGTNDFVSGVGSSAWFFDFAFGIPAEGGPQPLLSYGSQDDIEGIGGGSFFADSMSVNIVSPTQANVSFQGLWVVDGFDPTEGSLVWTAEALGELGTFSATGTVANQIPVPGALLLFASALSGLGFARRRSA